MATLALRTLRLLGDASGVGIVAGAVVSGATAAIAGRGDAVTRDDATGATRLAAGDTAGVRQARAA
jgi:hypothetical protein